METTEPQQLAPEIMAAMEKAVHFAMTGEADPEFLRWVREQAESVREEVFRRHGVLDIGVPAIRALRDDAEE